MRNGVAGFQRTNIGIFLVAEKITDGSLSGLTIVKSERAHARTLATRDEAAIEIFEYIECFYNRARIHSALGWMSPDEFERAYMEEVRLRAT